jgi:hypothetical protein
MEFPKDNNVTPKNGAGTPIIISNKPQPTYCHYESQKA